MGPFLTFSLNFRKPQGPRSWAGSGPCLFTLFWLLEEECEFILVFLPSLPLPPPHFQSETSLSAQTHFITSGNVDAKMKSIRIQDQTCSVKSQETTFSTWSPAVQSSEQRPIRPIRWWVRTFPTVAEPTQKRSQLHKDLHIRWISPLYNTGNLLI